MSDEKRSPIKKLYAEIVRRRVQRTLAGYAVCVVSVLTMADLILPSLPVPESAYDLLVVFFVLMLPIVFYLSWNFDLTFGGIVRTADMDERSSVASSGNSVQAPLAPAVSISQSKDNYKSVAILPFNNESTDEGGDYLSDGITETIINKLARVASLKVTPRASAFRYKGVDQDIREIGLELGVDTIVTGLVKHQGDRLMVQAEITDVVNQNQIWGEHFSCLWENLFDVQEEIATEISASLKPELTGEELEKISRRETDKLEAYQEYLRGRYLWNKRTEDGLIRAITHFRDAIEKDPLYAAAYTGLADVYNMLGYYSVKAPEDTFPLAKEADTKALELEPDLAEAYASLGYVVLFYERNWDLAQQHFQKSIALKPNYGTAHQWYAWYYIVTGNYEAAVVSLKKAQELDPLSLIINDHLSYAYLLAGNVDKAKHQIDRTRTLDPDYPLAIWRLGDWCMMQEDYEKAEAAYSSVLNGSDGRYTLGYLGLCYGLMGRSKAAREVLKRLDDYSLTRYISPLDKALVYAGLGEADKTFQFVEEALTIRVSDMVRFGLLPWPDSIRSDPRFSETLELLQLPKTAVSFSQQPVPN